MPLRFWRYIQAGLTVLVVVASLVGLTLYEQYHEPPRRWCAKQGCLSKPWVIVAERILESELYTQASDPTQVQKLFLLDLGALRHQKGAVYQFLLLTLNKDPRFAVIASSMLLNGYRTEWKFVQEDQLKVAVLGYWHDHPGDGYWRAMLTGTAPRSTWSPAQLDSWARRNDSPGLLTE